MINGDLWKGVFIEEGFEDLSALDYALIKQTDSWEFEGEVGRGKFHFHKIEVYGAKLDEFVKLAQQAIKDSWYLHLVKGDSMKVIFSEIVFNVSRGDKEQFNHIRKYAISEGIHPEQLDLERLLDNPFD